MRIALVSYEYPPDTAIGGIATYVGQVAKLLYSKGNQVEVFTASETKSGYHIVNSIPVNYINSLDRNEFANLYLYFFIFVSIW